jgi:hypothetical protein
MGMNSKTAEKCPASVCFAFAAERDVARLDHSPHRLPVKFEDYQGKQRHQNQLDKPHQKGEFCAVDFKQDRCGVRAGVRDPSSPPGLKSIPIEGSEFRVGHTRRTVEKVI